MASSDLLDTNRLIEDEQDECGSEKRVCLPKPDVNNITVLTENLPNEPILPWHRFDSPWLGKDEAQAEAVDSQSDPLPVVTPDSSEVEQLSLELDGVVTPSSEPSIAGSITTESTAAESSTAVQPITPVPVVDRPEDVT
jgi:hypothetical protein